MLCQSLPWRKLTAFGKVTLEFSCSSQQETEVWRRRFDGPWGELWMVLHSNKVAMIWNNKERLISKDKVTSTTTMFRNSRDVRVYPKAQPGKMIYSMLYSSSLNSRCIQVFTMKFSTHPPIQWLPFSLPSHPGQQTEDRCLLCHPSALGSPRMSKDLMDFWGYLITLL